MLYHYYHFSNYYCCNIIIITTTYFYPPKPLYIYNYITIVLEFNIMIITTIPFTNFLQYYNLPLSLLIFLMTIILF